MVHRNPHEYPTHDEIFPPKIYVDPHISTRGGAFEYDVVGWGDEVEDPNPMKLKGILSQDMIDQLTDQLQLEEPSKPRMQQEFFQEVAPFGVIPPLKTEARNKPKLYQPLQKSNSAIELSVFMTMFHTMLSKFLPKITFLQALQKFALLYMFVQF